MTFMIAIISILTFLLGFTLGLKNRKKPLKKSYHKTLETEESTQEYQNFLSYDGTEQL